VTVTTSKTLGFSSGNHGNVWTIWEMKMLAHLMEKGLDAYLDTDFESSLPDKEIGPFNLTIEDKKNQKEAVDMNKKVMCHFIRAFSAMSLLKQGQSAKESRQALSEWKSMETVGGTSR
jgi:hypothetical protein